MHLMVKLNMMISHRLTDNYVLANLFSFDYDLFQSFYSVCKSFLLANFMNVNKILKKYWVTILMIILLSLVK